MVEEDNTSQGAAYSDEEFGSENEYDGGDDKFADEDVVANDRHDTDEQEEIPTGTNVEDADNYDAEFEEDVLDGPIVITAEPQQSGASGVQTDHIPTESDDVLNNSQDNAEPYDGEFDEESTLADVMPPTEEKNGLTLEEIPNAEMQSHADKRLNSSGNSEAAGTYLNDTEQNSSPALPNNVLLRNTNENSVTYRRSSVPSSAVSRLTEALPPQAQFVRAGSMPIVLSAAPLDKWMDSIPQELSSEKHDRSRKQSVCFPVLEGNPMQNPVEEEGNPDEDENCAEEDNNDPELASTGNSHARAQSYRDLQREKIVVPVRRSQSLLYAGSLPRVEEVRTFEEVADSPHNPDVEDLSDGGESYGEASQNSFESEHEHDEIHSILDERPKSGPSPVLHEMLNPNNVASNQPTCNEKGMTGTTGDTEPPSDSASPSDKSEASQSNKNDDEYADEMKDEFPSDSEDPNLKEEHKSSEDTSEYDVDEFIDDGRKDTEILLKEAHIILALQQKEGELHRLASGHQNAPSEILAQSGNSGQKTTEQVYANKIRAENTEGENFATRYNDDDEFADADADIPKEDTPEPDSYFDNDEGRQYEFDADDFEAQEPVLPQNDVQPHVEVADNAMNVKKPANSEVHIIDIIAVERSNEEDRNNPGITIRAESEEPKPVMQTEQPTDRTEAIEVQVETSPAQPSDFTVTIPPATVVTDQEEKETPTNTKEATRPEPISRPNRPVKIVSSITKQQVPLLKPLQKMANRTPVPPTALSTPSTDKKTMSAPRSSRSKLKPSTPDHQAKPTKPAIDNNSGTVNGSCETSKTPTPPESSPKSRPKHLSPRSPSKTASGLTTSLPNEYPQLPRKAPVPRQKIRSKPSTSGDDCGKRRLLQPVKTPANLRFDLPKMDKTKRDWLFVNMFRHGDDLSKYDAFVPPALRARPPTSSNLTETRKRPLSARQTYWKPQTQRFISPSRRLVQPDPALQDRERNWVPTTPHDSKLPPYDSILDKYCTTVTSPVVQRQIYQTRNRDLSPQLAYVLEKRVEKHCRQGFYDSFGGVSSSYKTEIVPTSPGDGSRQRLQSSWSSMESGMLATSNTAAPDEEVKSRKCHVTKLK
ncbi:unnamed protein product [Phytophthora fragariaefolia]|uniref:Unnamed protein product n=1 Tax=Phytophthora fragariaefolia TaxID=1490495 RepID=A0A9W6Y0Z1_9STRA|nr:unnamed protein product [Phytophthora fragariaefolia]